MLNEVVAAYLRYYSRIYVDEFGKTAQNLNRHSRSPGPVEYEVREWVANNDALADVSVPTDKFKEKS